MTSVNWHTLGEIICVGVDTVSDYIVPKNQIGIKIILMQLYRKLWKKNGTSIYERRKHGRLPKTKKLRNFDL